MSEDNDFMAGLEVGCYSAHLYCAGINHRTIVEYPASHSPLDVCGRNLSECRKAARDHGWKRVNGKWFCDICIKEPQP